LISFTGKGKDDWSDDEPVVDMLANDEEEDEVPVAVIKAKPKGKTKKGKKVEESDEEPGEDEDEPSKAKSKAKPKKGKQEDSDDEKTKSKSKKGKKVDSDSEPDVDSEDDTPLIVKSKSKAKVKKGKKIVEPDEELDDENIPEEPVKADEIIIEPKSKPKPSKKESKPTENEAKSGMTTRAASRKKIEEVIKSDEEDYDAFDEEKDFDSLGMEKLSLEDEAPKASDATFVIEPAAKKLTHKEKKKLKKQQEFEKQLEITTKKGGQGHSALGDNFTVSQTQKTAAQLALMENAVDIKVVSFFLSRLTISIETILDFTCHTR